MSEAVWSIPWLSQKHGGSNTHDMRVLRRMGLLNKPYHLDRSLGSCLLKQTFERNIFFSQRKYYLLVIVYWIYYLISLRCNEMRIFVWPWQCPISRDQVLSQKEIIWGKMVNGFLFLWPASNPNSNRTFGIGRTRPNVIFLRHFPTLANRAEIPNGQKSRDRYQQLSFCEEPTFTDWWSPSEWMQITHIGTNCWGILFISDKETRGFKFWRIGL